MNATYPWQVTPTELIKHAIELLHRGTETDRQIAFLLLDVGIETMFKQFLMLPESFTGVRMGYSKRTEATQGSFFSLIEAMKDAGKDRISAIDLEKVMYYHSIRNKLYHEGDGVVPTTVNTRDYAVMATELLYSLLSVDMRQLLFEDYNKEELIEKRKKLIDQKLGPIREEINKRMRSIKKYLLTQLEEGGSEFPIVTFADDMEEYISKMAQPEARRWKSGIRRLINEGLFILDEESLPVDCYEWEYGDGVLEFLTRMMEERSPAGPYPKQLVDFLEENELIYAEYTVAEIITADDFTEVLLLVTNLMEDFPQIISIEDYREMRSILTCEIDLLMSEEDFENKLSEIEAKGKRLLNQI